LRLSSTSDSGMLGRTDGLVSGLVGLLPQHPVIVLRSSGVRGVLSHVERCRKILRHVTSASGGSCAPDAHGLGLDVCAEVAECGDPCASRSSPHAEPRTPYPRNARSPPEPRARTPGTRTPHLNREPGPQERALPTCTPNPVPGTLPNQPPLRVSYSATAQVKRPGPLDPGHELVM
jgi:hypothetical protein